MHELIPHIGNYKKLLSYQKADVIYQMTFDFCSRFLQKGDRTVDQMVQAARSGKQNIIEGCAASCTSAKTEIKLVNVAKASLKSFLRTMRTFLRLGDIVNGNRGASNMKPCVLWEEIIMMLNFLWESQLDDRLPLLQIWLSS